MNGPLQKKKRPHEGGVGPGRQSLAGSMCSIVTPIDSHVKSVAKGQFGGVIRA